MHTRGCNSFQMQLCLQTHQPGYLPSPLSISLDANMLSGGEGWSRSGPQVLTTGGQLRRRLWDRRETSSQRKQADKTTPRTAEPGVGVKMKLCGQEQCSCSLTARLNHHQLPKTGRGKEEERQEEDHHRGSQKLHKQSLDTQKPRHLLGESQLVSMSAGMR